MRKLCWLLTLRLFVYLAYKFYNYNDDDELLMIIVRFYISFILKWQKKIVFFLYFAPAASSTKTLL